MIPRRTLTVYRQSGGQYVDGVWQPGSETALTKKYSVQPTSPHDMQMLPEGRRDRKSYTLYGDDLLQSVTDQNPDQVEIDGERFEVNMSENWQNGLIPHCKAVVTRLDEQ